MKFFIVVFSVVLLAGCGGDGFNVTAKFENTQDIKDGAPVYYEGKRIGEVSDVVLHETGSLIEINIASKSGDLLATKSAIVVNRLKSGAPLEIYNRLSVNAEKLQDGQQIEGLDSMFQLGAWMVGDVIKTGTGSLTNYVDAFQTYLNGSEFEEGKAQVQAQITDITQSASAAVKTVEDEITTAINDFSVNEEKMAETMNQLGDELSPIVGEVAKSSSELIQQFEQLVTNIESTVEQSDAPSGEKLIESLIGTLEKLNESIEEGVKESQE